MGDRPSPCPGCFGCQGARLVDVVFLAPPTFMYNSVSPVKYTIKFSLLVFNSLRFFHYIGIIYFKFYVYACMLLVTLFLKIYLVIEIFAFLKSILSIHCYLLHSVYTRILPVTSWTRTQGSWQSTFLTQGDNTVTLPPPWTVTTPALVSWGTKFPPQNPSIPSSSTH